MVASLVIYFSAATFGPTQSQPVPPAVLKKLHEVRALMIRDEKVRNRGSAVISTEKVSRGTAHYVTYKFRDGVKITVLNDSKVGEANLNFLRSPLMDHALTEEVMTQKATEILNFVGDASIQDRHLIVEVQRNLDRVFRFTQTFCELPVPGDARVTIDTWTGDIVFLRPGGQPQFDSVLAFTPIAKSVAEANAKAAVETYYGKEWDRPGIAQWEWYRFGEPHFTESMAGKPKVLADAKVVTTMKSGLFMPVAVVRFSGNNLSKEYRFATAYVELRQGQVLLIKFIDKRPY